MTYRELLKLYKKNELDERKKTEVEADIERQEAISDYLYEKAEIPGLEASSEENIFTIAEDDTASKQEQNFTKMVNRSIRKAFLKMGTVIGIVILVLVLFVQFALPQIVSSFYYNPGKEIAENTNQMSLDMAIYSELVIPCYIRDNVSVVDKGFGNYDICIYQNSSYNGIFTNLSGKIEKGKLTLYNTNILRRPPVNIFSWFQIDGDSSDSLTNLVSEGQTIYGADVSDMTEELQNLTENTYYVAYVTLDRMMEYDDFMKFLSDWNELSVWCAVDVNGGDSQANDWFNTDNIGFMCTFSTSKCLNWDREKYPNLLLWDNAPIDDGNIEELEKTILDEDFMTTRFTSMLRYMSEQQEFLSMMESSGTFFSDAADYVEKNGLIVYGFATIADKNTLLKLNEMDEVYTINTQSLK